MGETDADADWELKERDDLRFTLELTTGRQ